jgi:hypothetical protein
MDFDRNRPIHAPHAANKMANHKLSIKEILAGTCLAKSSDQRTYSAVGDLTCNDRN